MKCVCECVCSLFSAMILHTVMCHTKKIQIKNGDSNRYGPVLPGTGHVSSWNEMDFFFYSHTAATPMHCKWPTDANKRNGEKEKKMNERKSFIAYPWSQFPFTFNSSLYHLSPLFPYSSSSSISTIGFRWIRYFEYVLLVLAHKRCDCRKIKR